MYFFLNLPYLREIIGVLYRPGYIGYSLNIDIGNYRKELFL